jgi:hypothetical protein
MSGAIGRQPAPTAPWLLGPWVQTGHDNEEPEEGARIEALVAARAAALEAISPVRRSGLLSEPFSRVIRRHLAWIRARGRREIERVFAEELKQRAPAARRDLLEALTVAASWSTWEALRAHQELSPAQARRVMKRTLTALLEQE